ncbi:hypothetical protein EG329_002158 [Mollisiaceae sp. DMI_Dod_QoI]|nr:hypothetical protein EG329_002158 [Helotiales sp. DMI_Dod_QoI]
MTKYRTAWYLQDALPLAGPPQGHKRSLRSQSTLGVAHRRGGRWLVAALFSGFTLDRSTISPKQSLLLAADMQRSCSHDALAVLQEGLQYPRMRQTWPQGEEHDSQSDAVRIDIVEIPYHALCDYRMKHRKVTRSAAHRGRVHHLSPALPCPKSTIANTVRSITSNADALQLLDLWLDICGGLCIDLSSCIPRTWFQSFISPKDRKSITAAKLLD